MAKTETKLTLSQRFTNSRKYSRKKTANHQQIKMSLDVRGFVYAYYIHLHTMYMYIAKKILYSKCRQTRQWDANGLGESEDYTVRLLL